MRNNLTTQVGIVRCFLHRRLFVHVSSLRTVDVLFFCGPSLLRCGLTVKGPISVSHSVYCLWARSCLHAPRRRRPTEAERRRRRRRELLCPCRSGNAFAPGISGVRCGPIRAAVGGTGTHVDVLSRCARWLAPSWGGWICCRKGLKGGPLDDMDTPLYPCLYYIILTYTI